MSSATKPVEQKARELLIERLRRGVPRGTSGYLITATHIRHPLLDEAADVLAALNTDGER